MVLQGEVGQASSRLLFLNVNFSTDGLFLQFTWSLQDGGYLLKSTFQFNFKLIKKILGV